MAIRRKPLASYLHGYATKARKLFRLGHPLSELDPELSQKKIVLEAPPFEPDLVAAIKLISPQFRLDADEKSRRFWQLNQNGLCWGEYDALAPFIARIPTPKKVLDIGPGMGRSVVFFKKHLGWEKVPFHLYESSGNSTRYTKAGPRFKDSFCGNLEALQRVLDHNGIEEFEVFDAAEMDAQVGRMPGPYDFIYSFFAVGFHWSLEHFLADILDLMHGDSLGAFTLHDRFDNFACLDGVPHRVVEFKKTWPRYRWSRLLVLSKNPELVKAP